jgi:hypothetical protein
MPARDLSELDACSRRKSEFDACSRFIGVPRFSGPQPQFWPADRLYIVVACGGHFRGPPRGAALRGLSHSMLNVECSPVFLALNHNSSRRTVCIWWCPFEAIFAASRVAQLYAVYAASPRFFFSPGFLRVPFWSKKRLNPFKSGPFCVSEIVQKKFKK